MIENCISLYRKEQEDKATKIYMAECLRTLTENTAKSCGGPYIRTKLKDIIEPAKEETRTPQEIIEKIGKKLKQG